MLDWVLAHKEMIALYGTYVGSTWVALRWLRKTVYRPSKAWWKKQSDFIEEIKEGLKELKHNGGQSIKDISVQNKLALIKIGKDVVSMKADQDADFQLSREARFKCNSLGECNAVNDSLCRLYGATDEKLLGYNWLSYVHQNSRNSVENFWRNGLKSNSVISSDYSIVNGETDEEIQCEYVAYVKRNSDGEIISISGIVNKK